MFHCVIPSKANTNCSLKSLLPSRTASGFHRLAKQDLEVTTQSGRSDDPTRSEPLRSQTASNPRKVTVDRKLRNSRLKSSTRKRTAVVEKPQNDASELSSMPQADFDKQPYPAFMQRCCRSYPLLLKSVVRSSVRAFTRTFVHLSLAAMYADHTRFGNRFKKKVQHHTAWTDQVFFCSLVRWRTQNLQKRLSTDEFSRECKRLCDPETERTLVLYDALWTLKTEKGLRSAYSGNNGLMYRRRLPVEMRETWAAWEMLDDFDRFEKRLENLLPIFTLRDLTQKVTEIPAFLLNLGSSEFPSRFWLNVALPVPTLHGLREIYAELSPLYDNYHPDYFDRDYPSTQKALEDQLNYVLKKRDICEARRQCRFGCCTTNRDAMWTLLLRDKHLERTQFRKLLTRYVRYELCTDWIMVKSVYETVGNSEQFFNFVPMIQQIMQLFLRDDRMLDCSKICTSRPVHLSSQLLGSPIRRVPPNGIIPFHELGMYAAPLAYAFLNVRPAYFTFFELYYRYFQFLHTFSTHPQGVLSLYALFENLLYVQEPELWETLRVKMKFNIVDYVVPWITMAFCGFIEVDQLLFLWDRIIGFNDLRILSILSVAVFVIRKTALMKAKSARELEAALADILNIEIVPLMQMVLFL